jgi:hypothetical protein
MKKILMLFVLMSTIINLNAQTDTRVITTAVPFLLVSGDARASAMGDMGVATSADAFSQYWNAAKYNSIESKTGFGISYTPYLSQLVNDIKILNANYYHKLNERSAFGVSLKYFGLGEIDLSDSSGQYTGTVSPNEFAVDGSYALKLSNTFSMAVTMRFINSDLKLGTGNDDASAAQSFSVDLSGYYESEEIDFKDYKGKLRLGYNIQNLGPKMKYYKSDEGDFLPTNLRLGAGFDFILDDYNEIGLTFETNKLLVPTPPIRDNNGAIVEGKDDNVNWMSGIFQSFGDAPGGMSEELKEFQWSLGTEYTYLDAFSLRAGYFHESEIKGKRKYFTVGAGFKYNYMIIDMSYIFSTGKLRSPLDNTMRFSLTFNIDDFANGGADDKKEE